MKVRFLPASDTRENWLAKNPVALPGEICVEMDTGRWKFGDGSRPYSELPYATQDFTQEFFEVQKLAAEIQGTIEAEADRSASETERRQQEAKREALYQQLIELAGQLGQDPVVEVIQDIKDIREAGRATAHLIDSAKDLYAAAGKLYRLTHVIEGGSPWLKHIEVGKAILNGGVELTAPGDAPRMRLYWKAQGERSESDAYIAAWTDDDQANWYVGEIDSYTRQYSAVFDLSATRTVTLSTLTAWGQEVKVWDFDWRVDV